MNPSMILIIVAAVVALSMLAFAFAGPSAGKAKNRRLASVRDRHAASTEAVVAAQMRKTIQSVGGQTGTNLSNLIPRRELMEKRLETMLAAMKTVRPAFDAFYATLSAEQKAKLDQAGPRRWGWRHWGWRN